MKWTGGDVRIEVEVLRLCLNFEKAQLTIFYKYTMKLLTFLLPCLMLFVQPAFTTAQPNPVTCIKKDAKKICEYYRQRVLKGESMASIAQLYSEDPGSAPNGGQYNNVVPGMMVPEFEKVAYSLKTGEISEVFETQYGFHFIQLISRKGDVLSLRHLLITRD